MIEVIELLEEIDRLKSENDRLKTELYVRNIRENISNKQLHKAQEQKVGIIDDFIRAATFYVYYSKDLKDCVVPFHNLKDIKKDVLRNKGW